jgi:hypothetical protein
MYLFKAKAAAAAELERVCAEHGVTLEEVRAFLDSNPRYAAGLHKSPHRAAGTAADMVAEVAPLIQKTKLERTLDAAKNAATLGVRAVRRSPAAVADRANRALGAARQVAGWIREDLRTYRETKNQPRA